jgi:hypothetical protein
MYLNNTLMLATNSQTEIITNIKSAGREAIATGENVNGKYLTTQR